MQCVERPSIADLDITSGQGFSSSNNNNDLPPPHEEYTARDEGLEPYSAPKDHPASSGYLPEKKIGPDTTSNTNEQNNTAATATSDNTPATTAPAIADGADNAVSRDAEPSGNNYAGVGAIGGAGYRGGNDNDHNNANTNTSNNNYLSPGNVDQDEGDHTDTEAPDMKPSQSYIQRQSLYSQPESTGRGLLGGQQQGQSQQQLDGEPLAQQNTQHSYADPNQAYGGGQRLNNNNNNQGIYQEQDFGPEGQGQGQDHHLIPAGGGIIRPVAGVAPQDAEGGALARHPSYAQSSRSKYTQAGMAGVGAGTLAAGATAVGTGHPDTAQYVQDPYSQQQQQQQHQQPQNEYGQAQQMQQYPTQQTFDTQRSLQPNEQMQQPYQQQQQQQPNMMYAQQPFENNQQQQNGHIPEQAEQSQQQGPHTGVVPLNAGPEPQQQLGDNKQDNNLQSPNRTSAALPIAGGGLAAAITTSGHDLTKSDKKNLKKEIRSERKFEKSLAEEAKKEAEEIGIAMKMAKLSLKKADKSGRYEANFRSTHEKAVKKEVAAKKRLLRVTNEYNKIAADLERVSKEAEIRRNQHIADVQTRDADSNRVDELRRLKGQHDMEREARHGDSLTKQKQAKRALSMSSKRKSSLF